MGYIINKTSTGRDFISPVNVYTIKLFIVGDLDSKHKHKRVAFNSYSFFDGV